jgi:hypothetical protein
LEIYKERGRLNANLARRVISPIGRIVFSQQEKAVYDALEHYCKGLAERFGHRANGGRAQALGFYLSFLRLRFASSLYAIGETLRRRRDRVVATRRALARANTSNEEDREDQLFGDGEGDEDVVGELLHDRSPEDLAWEAGQLDQLLAALGSLTAIPSKIKELLRVVEHRRKGASRVDQMVVFTRFKDTLDDIVHRLRENGPGLLIGTYSGEGAEYVDPATRDWIGVDRDEIKHRFVRGDIDILVCTDAAAEGLNLQSADLLINYDLPWNPMKVEQRIGRIDRIGQQHKTIYVLNLCYADSAEDIVYGRLLERLSQARLIVGNQRLSLLPMTGREFEDLAAGRLSETELMQRAEQRARVADAQQRRMEMPARDLFEIYERFNTDAALNRPPVTLDDIWTTISGSSYLRSLGCRVLAGDKLRALELNHIPGVSDGTVLTASRKVFERGLREVGVLRFATYGDPAFDSVLAVTTVAPLPPGIRRVSVPIPATEGAELVGYVVMARAKSASVAPTVVTDMSSLQDLIIEAETVVPADAIEKLTAQLAEVAKDEFRVFAAAARIEEINEKAARAQTRFAHLVARHFILSVQRAHRGEASFARQLSVLDDIVENGAVCRLPRMPVDDLRSIMDGGVPFTIPLPIGSREVAFDAPRPLLKAAVDLAARKAEALHQGRASVTTDQVLARL